MLLVLGRRYSVFEYHCMNSYAVEELRNICSLMLGSENTIATTWANDYTRLFCSIVTSTEKKRTRGLKLLISSGYLQLPLQFLHWLLQ